MPFGFPVVLCGEPDPNIVCVVLSECCTGDNLDAKKLDQFSYREIYGAARVHFAASHEHQLSGVSIFRKGTKLTGADFLTARDHRAFKGDSAGLAILLQTLSLGYHACGRWAQNDIVWATGAVAERRERIRLVSVRRDKFQSKLAAFADLTEPARILICPNENWRNARQQAGLTPVPVAVLESDDTFETFADRKVVVPCEEHELVRLVRCIFPEFKDVASQAPPTVHLNPLGTTLATIVALVAGVGVYSYVRVDSSTVGASTPQLDLEWRGANLTYRATTSATLKDSSTVGSKQIALRKSTAYPQVAHIAHPPIATGTPLLSPHTAIPCEQLQVAIDRSQTQRDKECGSSSNLLPVETDECNKRWGRELEKLRERGATCTTD